MENDLIQRFADRTGFNRYVLSGKKPSSVGDIQVFVCLGDLHSTLFCSKVFKDRFSINGGYNVVLTWPGLQKFFDVDEVLTLNENVAYKKFHDKADGLRNEDGNLQIIIRSLNEYFMNVHKVNELIKEYDTCLNNDLLKTKSFSLDSYKFLKFYNSVLSVPLLKKRVLFFPIDYHKKVTQNKLVPYIFDYRIYVEIFKQLGKRGFQVCCIQNGWTINLHDKITDDFLTFVQEDDFSKVLMFARAYGCFFDLLTDMSIFGNLAQAPVFSVTERSYFVNKKRDLESYIFDYTGVNKFVFSFYEAFYTSEGLNYDFISSIIDRFVEFYEYDVSVYGKDIVDYREVDFAEYIKEKNKFKKAKFISKLLVKKEREKYHEEG